MKTSKLFVVSAIISFAAGVSAPAFAGKASNWSLGQSSSGNGSFLPQSGARIGFPTPNNNNGRMSLTQLAAGLVPLVQVIESINAQEPGTQLDTNTVVENGRTIYVVRWQASRGRIIIFRVDAETGQILGRQS